MSLPPVPAFTARPVLPAKLEPASSTLANLATDQDNPPAWTSSGESTSERLSAIESSKRLAAWTAVDRHVAAEHKVIGIGSGSTVPYVVERIAAQGKALNEDRVFIPTGFQSQQLILSAGLVLGDIHQFPEIDVTIDGADECDTDLNAIKGGGACHLREKVLAESAKVFVIVADSRKNSLCLGTNYTRGVPVEVAQFAYTKVLRELRALGSPDAALRMAVQKAGPVVTDNGGFVIDAPFPAKNMSQPDDLLAKIKMLTGIFEVGLFCGMAKAAYFGREDGTVVLRTCNASDETIENGYGDDIYLSS